MTFGVRLLVAMMVLVTAVTFAVLYVARRNVESTVRRFSEERFESEARFFTDLQRTRLAAVSTKCAELARSVRLLAAVEERDPDLLYRIALDELRDVLRPDAPVHASFFRLVEAAGNLVPTDDRRAGGPPADEAANWERRVARAAMADVAERQRVGYVPVGDGRVVEEVVVSSVDDAVTARRLGALVVGFPVEPLPMRGHGEEDAHGGLWIEGRLYATTLPEPARAEAERVLAATARDGPAVVETSATLGGASFRVFARPLGRSSGFPVAWQTFFYPLARSIAEARDLRWRVLASGAVALAAALVLAAALARGLAVPIRDLSAAARSIAAGDFSVRVRPRTRDEVGRLSAAFNEMAEGLAQKERIRSILDVVADARVADELLRGGVALGGELRDVSILFADIRGFTPLTREMPPTDVIDLLNRHMTELTRAVHASGGIVDKFLGDAVMAIFGAPTSTGDDARNAVRAALHMIRERRRLNAEGGTPLEIGVGIASGRAVAGCMGSSDRLSYTVLGERVNLAARIAAVAGRSEVLVDAETLRRCADGIRAEELPAASLKGYDAPVVLWRVTGEA